MRIIYLWSTDKAASVSEQTPPVKFLNYEIPIKQTSGGWSVLHTSSLS